MRSTLSHSPASFDQLSASKNHGMKALLRMVGGLPVVMQPKTSRTAICSRQNRYGDMCLREANRSKSGAPPFWSIKLTPEVKISCHASSPTRLLSELVIPTTRVTDHSH
jgi:hypothetical protein